MSDWRIPLSDLDYGPEEEAAVLRVLKSKWLSMGAETRAFETEFAQFIGVKHTFAVANATAGLHLAFLSLGLRAGDEVIQPAINFVASANMTVAVGATPVFADILSLAEPTISPEEIERLITPKTKAVVVMHYGGYLCRIAEIREICQRHGLALVEDACHAVGAACQSESQGHASARMAGNLGDISAFSFFSNKNLATGEGGMVATNRDDIADRLRLLRSHGMTTLTWDRHKGHASNYDVVLNGFNYRLDELHSAIGRSQLQKLKNNNERRKQLVSTYQENMSALSGWILPFANWHGDSAYHLMTVVAPNEAVRCRAVEELRAAGIQTSLHYPCVCDFAAFRGGQGDGPEVARQFARRVVTLPLYPALSADGVRTICRSLLGCCALPNA